MTLRTIGNFQLTELIGEGGMGEVYRGLDTMLEREVAIKTLRPELAARPELVERFRVEAIALAKLNHPNIAAVYSFFRDGTQHHMAMQFVRGDTLETILTKRGRLPWAEAARIGVDVLHALDHAHALGVIHRDLKPGNLMLEASGRTVVMDFGIARVLARARQTRSGNLVGTMEYIAPELIKGQDADARSDLYSLGVVLYELATGRLPFEANTDYELMRAHAELEPPPPERICPDLPPEFSTVVLRALAKTPDQRYASAREFLAALAKAGAIAPNVMLPDIEPAYRRVLGNAGSVRSNWLRGVDVLTGIFGKRGGDGRAAAAPGGATRSARVTNFARENPGMAVAAVAGVVAAGFASAGAYKAITKPKVEMITINPVPTPKAAVIVTPPPIAPKAAPVDAKSDGIYRMPDIPKAVVSIEGPGQKPPAKDEAALPSSPPPEKPAPQPVAKPPAPPRPQPQPTEVAKPVPRPQPPPVEVAKPAPKPQPSPPATVAAKPPAPPPPPPPVRKETPPPTPADSGWNIRR